MHASKPSTAPAFPSTDQRPNPGTPEQPPPSPAARDSRGRFAKGNRGGPGNPFTRRVAALRSVLIEAVSDDDLRLVAQVLLEQAKAGDLAAAKLLLQYTLGKPAPAVDPDRLDAEEVALFQQEAFTAQQLIGVLHGVSATVALGALRGAVPALSGEYLEQLKQALCAPPPEPPAQPQPAAPPAPAATVPAAQPGSPARPAPEPRPPARVPSVAPPRVPPVLPFPTPGAPTAQAGTPHGATDSKRTVTERRCANSSQCQPPPPKGDGG